MRSVKMKTELSIKNIGIHSFAIVGRWKRKKEREKISRSMIDDANQERELERKQRNGKEKEGDGKSTTHGNEDGYNVDDDIDDDNERDASIDVDDDNDDDKDDDVILMLQ